MPFGVEIFAHLSHRRDDDVGTLAWRDEEALGGVWIGYEPAHAVTDHLYGRNLPNLVQKTAIATYLMNRMSGQREAHEAPVRGTDDAQSQRNA